MLPFELITVVFGISDAFDFINDRLVNVFVNDWGLEVVIGPQRV